MDAVRNPLQWEVVTKLSAAQRQLDCALKLWFEDGDQVSIHTLVGAAYQLVNDINVKRGGKDLLFDSEIVADDYRDKFRKAMRRDFMFFKHADRDSDKVTAFPPFITILFITVTIETLRSLREKSSDIQIAFTSWMSIFSPDLVTSDFKAPFENAPPEYRAMVRQMNKPEYLEHALEGLAAHRAEVPRR